MPAKLVAHELVLLHGQPGSAADWLQVAGRLPAQLHAVAADRPGYGSSRLRAGGFAANAQAVLDDLDSRGIERAVLVGHSYGGGVALSAASLAPHRVEAVVLLASVGPGCVNRWDRLLAAPLVGPLCALVAWRLTPWIARARLAQIGWRRGRPPRPDEHVNWQIWGQAGRQHAPLWRTFLTEQRALIRELGELERAIPSVQRPVLLLADPQDALVPIDTGRRLARALPDARLQLVPGAGHHLPRRAPDAVADAITAFLAAVEDPASSVWGAQPHLPGTVASRQACPRRSRRRRQAMGEPAVKGALRTEAPASRSSRHRWREHLMSTIRDSRTRADLSQSDPAPCKAGVCFRRRGC
jgi:pimeloyl-ACP methyl ester carboxylesterase